jgi:hypothetical protein
MSASRGTDHRGFGLLPDEVQLTGVEWSPAMLDIARHRAGQLM